MATKIPIKYKDPYKCYAMYSPAQNLAVHQVVEAVKVRTDLTPPEKWCLAMTKLDDLHKTGMKGVTDTIVGDEVFVNIFLDQETRNLVNSYSYYTEKGGTHKFKKC
jgi:hypothetical protein